MTMIVDTKCEDGQEASGVKGGGGGEGGGGGKGGGGGGGVLHDGVGGRLSEAGIKLEPGLIWPRHLPPPSHYLAPPKTEIKVTKTIISNNININININVNVNINDI